MGQEVRGTSVREKGELLLSRFGELWNRSGRETTQCDENLALLQSVCEQGVNNLETTPDFFKLGVDFFSERDYHHTCVWHSVEMSAKTGAEKFPFLNLLIPVSI